MRKGMKRTAPRDRGALMLLIVILLFAATIALMAIRQIARGPTFSVSDEALWPVEHWELPPLNGQCRKTKFFPFLVGCPASCSAIRPDRPADEVFYRTDVMWRFGTLQDMHNASAASATSDTKLSSRFSASVELLRAFAAAEGAVERGVRERTTAGDVAGLDFMRQETIEVSLAYLCCLNLEEVGKVQAAVARWLPSQKKIDFEARFDRIECWQKSDESVTSILIADDASQRRFMHHHRSLIATVENAGVPVPVTREDQMPFHIALLGLQTKSKQKISAYLELVASAVQAAGSIVARGINTRVHGAPALSNCYHELK